MAHGYYNLQGTFVTTSTQAEATNAWREERGYSTGGVYDMGGGNIIDAREESPAPATPAPAAAPATPAPATPGTTEETAAERNARLQAAFNQASTSQPLAPGQSLDQRLYNLSQFGTPPAVPSGTQQQYSIFGEPIDLEGPIGMSFADQPLGQEPYQDERQYDLSSRFGTPAAVVPNPIDYSRLTLGESSQFTGPLYQSSGSEQALLGPVAQAEEWFLGTGDRWGLGSSYIGIEMEDRKPPAALSLSTVRILTSGDDVTMEDVERIYEYNPETGHYLLKEGTGAGDDYYGDGYYNNSGTASYLRGTTGPGYTGRYAGASTGLINWRIGF